jgi:hypothetical protein
LGPSALLCPKKGLREAMKWEHRRRLPRDGMEGASPGWFALGPGRVRTIRTRPRSGKIPGHKANADPVTGRSLVGRTDACVGSAPGSGSCLHRGGCAVEGKKKRAVTSAGHRELNSYNRKNFFPSWRKSLDFETSGGLAYGEGRVFPVARALAEDWRGAG